ncbi:hypothetical protein CMT56_13830 [Elizabethkingia anophelis]|uniref:Uncharacterized protein n=1 Tax=Elizabethkingia anophelis TaxID=1117645 RepID=A0A455ZFA6_9FLAO|nr:hypothetical protein [Elizabethkingia anophelis]AQW94915.1 hypothetical protein BBD30_12400 [Elizabethkingia anophelis]MCL1689644.1 hypothetical protein [Elizabethkingia anophelis]MDV3856189.1 hypothetical protein [Elizabethkingia anophelis]MDV3860891.1 hypothetical protein [Elizabethkingia anophelis]MDV3909339.1 hypothetical protein [Elizabethkingia anophelis]
MRFEYLTFLIYSPRGKSDNAKRSQLLLGACKRGQVAFSQNLAKSIIHAEIQDYFTETALIPIPRSSLTLQNSFLPSKVIADILIKNNLGNSVFSCLKRIKAIPKSSGQTDASKRNNVQLHLESLAVEPVLITERKIILIDDVFTLGRTAMAAAMKINEAYPDKEIRIFSPFRTRSFQDDNILKDIRRGYMELSANGKVKLPD